ncbi:MAG: 16S rRNA (guanine(527)-N(7))-methyltransferase RsmG [Clostridiales bacterium]|nr:16S rRNA (guanine(527)-N(7))-methyltransferase RsmG [Clostridiales bacterium]
MDCKFNLDKFENGLSELNISLSSAQMQQFLDYYQMLIEWNKKMNLTSITEFEDVVEKHFLDSLCIFKTFPQITDKKILDLGTGAGFPGIPIKIVFPDTEFVLMDSVNKKLTFLNAVINNLELNNISTVHGRAEDLARKSEYRQKFDLCVSRAVANLASLSEYCLPFVKIGGYFVSYKSGDIEEEAKNARKAIYLLGGKTEQIVRYRLPGTDANRSLVCIEKDRGTPKSYPRKAGIPSKQPIL